MVGLVVATHGELAAELLRTTEAIVGPVALASAVSVDSQTSVEEARGRLATAIHKVGTDGEGVLVLTDMFGGTPANLALTFLDEQIEVVTGVNLPMLIKLATTRADGLAAAAELACAHGQKNITLASALLRAKVQPARR
ncbi:MAG: PTS fructose transporter subunit IIA [Anaeromyxobacter sp.]|nr:PTS fructose transporter subunit IIA [Anaeromyxobacter sp.]MBL0278156.1 PTS fructose transporter subunit IIA [Anaeromyxobacter sp.]